MALSREAVTRISDSPLSTYQRELTQSASIAAFMQMLDAGEITVDDSQRTIGELYKERLAQYMELLQRISDDALVDGDVELIGEVRSFFSRIGRITLQVSSNLTDRASKPRAR